MVCATGRLLYALHWQEEAGSEKWLQSVLTAFYILSNTRILQAWESGFSCSTEWHRDLYPGKTSDLIGILEDTVALPDSQNVMSSLLMVLLLYTLSRQRPQRQLRRNMLSVMQCQRFGVTPRRMSEQTCVWCLQGFKPQFGNVIEARQRKSV